MTELTTEALNTQQRLKRAMQMRRLKERMAHAREISRHRLADAKKISQRALRDARTAVRVRLVGERGKHYADLSDAEKYQIDLQMEKKRALIRKLAERLVQGERTKEAERFHKMLVHDRMDESLEIDNILSEAVQAVQKTIVTPTHIKNIASIIEGSGILLPDAVQVFVEEYALTENEQDAYDAVSLFEATVIQRNFNRWAYRDREKKSVRGLTRRRLTTSGDERTRQQKHNMGYSARTLRQSASSLPKWKQRQPGFPPRDLAVTPSPTRQSVRVAASKKENEIELNKAKSTRHIIGGFKN